MVSLVGAIEEEEAEEESANGRAGAVVRQVFVNGFGNEKSFTGDLSINVMKDKSLVLFSKEALPSIRIYKSQNDLLCNQVHKDEPIDPKKLTNQLATLCDWTNLELKSKRLPGFVRQAREPIKMSVLCWSQRSSMKLPKFLTRWGHCPRGSDSNLAQPHGSSRC